ncbi:hypothetical protein Tco_0604482 [Tanacetum coccineum]
MPEGHSHTDCHTHNGIPSSDSSNVVNLSETELPVISISFTYFNPNLRVPPKLSSEGLFNTFDQYLIDELSEVQNVFHQMEQVVEQHRLESKMFEVKMNQVLNENERLLEQVINKDIMDIIVNSYLDNASVNVHECKKCLKLETELLNKKDFIEKDTYDKLFRINQKSVEISNLNVNLQEKDLVITALKDDWRKLKGKDLADNVVTKHTIAPEMLKINVEPIAPRLLNNKTAHSDYLRHTQETC